MPPGLFVVAPHSEARRLATHRELPTPAIASRRRHPRNPRPQVFPGVSDARLAIGQKGRLTK